MTFLFETSARPESVVRELKKAAADVGLKLSHTASQKAVAEMYGYKNWGSLSAAIGTGKSLDDADVDQVTRLSRRAAQVAVLTGLGFKHEVAAMVAERLSPTGRTVAEAQSAAVGTLDDYHPARAIFAVELAEEARQQLRDRPGDVDELYSRWAESRTLSPMDLLTFEAGDGYVVEGLFETANDLLEKVGYVVDVSAVASDLAAAGIAGERWQPEYPSDESRYFQFGANAFPSPFPGLGVEGCYVEFWGRPKADPDSVSFNFVVSDDEDADYGGATREMRLRNLLRGFRAEFAVCENEGVEAALAFGDDELAEAWRPFLGPLVSAAWNAFKASLDPATVFVDAVSGDAGPEAQARIARARSEARRKEVFKEIAESGEFSVRYIGRRPPAPDVYTEKTPVTDPIEFDEVRVRSLVEDAFEMFPLGAMNVGAARALDELVAQDPSLSGSRPLRAAAAVDALYVEASLISLMVARACNENGRTAQIASELLARVDNDDFGLVTGMTAIFVALGDEASARATAAKWAIDPANPKHAWSRVLVACAYDGEVAETSGNEELDRAVVESLLDMDTSPWIVFPREKETEPRWIGNQIACAQRDAWEKVDGWRETLERMVEPAAASAP